MSASFSEREGDGLIAIDAISAMDFSTFQADFLLPHLLQHKKVWPYCHCLRCISSLIHLKELHNEQCRRPLCVVEQPGAL
jgi:hypothetical protein